MKRVVAVGMLLMVFGVAGRSWAAGSGAAVHGVVRDIHGVPQMGAMVELLSGDASTLAVATTDERGRYTLGSIVPGQYAVRATAAFLVPVTRANLRLQAGAQVVVNLTMTTLFDAASWLPAQRRRADEPVDDWKWTLRSTASRPLLRLVDPNGSSMQYSSSAVEGSNKVETQARVSVTSGDGDFGEGGVHQVLLMNRTFEDGDSAIMRVDMGNPPAGFPIRPSAEMTVGYEHRTFMGGSTRLVSSYQSHPELTYASGDGLEVLQLASTEEVNLGDAVMIDAGTLMQAERLAATEYHTAPFVRAMVRPGDTTLVEYRFAAGRTLQSSDDLDHLKPQTDVVSDVNGRPLIQAGHHQEALLSQKVGTRTVAFAVYTDRIVNPGIAGSGMLDKAGLQGVAMITDPTTGTFRLAAQGYRANGVSASVVQPLTPALSAWAEYDFGTALWSAANGVTPTSSKLAGAFGPHNAQAASVAIRGKILHSGTSLKAEYRWQPYHTLTQVNMYDAQPDEAYLGFYLRQKVWCGRFLPQGVDAVVEATNLLEQGYQPVLGPDGQTLFLAQVPRAVQGGLAFNF